jgi:hypothetical protein
MLNLALTLPLMTTMAPPLYLDPGSGSIIIQAILAALLGAGIIIRTQWARIKKWFGRKPGETGSEDLSEDDE